MVGHGDARNKSFALPDKMMLAPHTAEVVAVLVALQNAPPEQDLVICSTRKTIRATIIDRLPAIEDRGWIGILDKEPLRVEARYTVSQSACIARTVYKYAVPRYTVSVQYI